MDIKTRGCRLQKGETSLNTMSLPNGKGEEKTKGSRGNNLFGEYSWSKKKKKASVPKTKH